MQAQAPFLLPAYLTGQWSAAIVLTYSVDLNFFESQLLHQLSEVPIRIVLADDEQLNATLQHALGDGLDLHRANRTYVVSPIRHSAAAHAKAVMLLGPSRGWMAVGSGNLNLDGYAGAGELWHAFAYEDTRPQHLAEFETVRALIDGLSPLVDEPARLLLDRAWGTASWLGTQSTPAVVRHNLDSSLFDQLAREVTWPVEIMRIHAPFYDKNLNGLAALLQRFQPRVTEVYTTPDTSADGTAMDLAVRSAHSRAHYFSVDVKDHPGTYIHAKWIHLIGQETEALVAGSANISTPALLARGPQGNLELVTLRTGPRGSFDRLYTPLAKTTVRDPANLVFRASPPPSEQSAVVSAHLLWAELEGRLLTLVFDRALPDKQGPFGIRGPRGTVTPLTQKVLAEKALVALSEEGGNDIEAGGFLEVFSGDVSLGVVWPYKLDALSARLNRSDLRDALSTISELPPTDAGLMDLLAALEETLVFDQRSAWRVARPTAPPPEDADPDESVVFLEDLDWERIRRDPRYSAYLVRKQHTPAQPSDLQVILAAISGRLGEIGQLPAPVHREDDEDLGKAPGEPGEEQDEGDDTDTVRRLPITTRTRMAWDRFVARYVRAIRDERFITQLGPLPAIQNAIVFSELLRQLLRDRLADYGRVVTAQVAIWKHLWGAPGHPGLIASLDQNDRAFIEETLEYTGLREATISGLADAAYQVLDGELRDDVVEEVANLITSETFDLTRQRFTKAVGSAAQRAGSIQTLVSLLAPRDEREVAKYVLDLAVLRQSDAEWTEVGVSRFDPDRKRSGTSKEVVLVVHGPLDSPTHDSMAGLLAREMAATELGDCAFDYWRIQFDDKPLQMAFWDGRSARGATSLGPEDEDYRELDALSPAWPAWWLRLAELNDERERSDEIA
jgi:hypothetical protein